MIATALLFLLASVPVGDWEHAPRPDEYPAPAAFNGTPAAVTLATKEARLFRTVLRKGARKGPNFAGDYTVVVWGCGLDSFMLAVVDARTGDVNWPPFGCMTGAGGFGIPYIPAPQPNPAFKLTSKLLVVLGVEDSDTAKAEDRAYRFYVFEDGTFRLAYTIPAPEPPPKKGRITTR